MPTYKQDMTATSGNMGSDKRKAYKADKKKYKSAVKENKQKQKQYKSNVKSQTKMTNKANKAEEKKQRKNPGSIKTFYDFAVMRPKLAYTGEKPKKSDYKPSADDNENIGRGGKGPKPMSKTRRAKASVMKLKDGLVNRFQGSTPKVGKNELMKPVIESLKPSMAIKPKPVKKK